jgi:hypothetical protein
MVAFLQELRASRDGASTPADSPVQSPVLASDEDAAQGQASTSRPSGGAEPAVDASVPAGPEDAGVDE